MTKIEQIADEIALHVYPLTGMEKDRQELSGTIMELALEIKRAAIEGEW